MPLSETETIVEFGPEQAGVRVGWSVVEEREHGASLDLVVATVEPHGAVESYHIADGGERLHGAKSITGFRSVTGISVLLPQEGELPQDLTPSLGHSKKPEGRAVAMLGYGVGRAESNVVEQKQWNVGTGGILTGIKDSLSNAGAEQYYPWAYFVLNTSIGHAVLGENGSLHGGELDNLLLADPEMQDETERWNGAAVAVRFALGVVIAEDESMLRELTVFGRTAPEEVPDYFGGSRRKVRHHELLALQAADDLPHPAMAHLSTGDRSLGRTWPYMDPMEADENKSFGLALNGLKRRNVQPAQHELEREIREANARLLYTSNCRLTLSKLLELERAQS